MKTIASFLILLVLSVTSNKVVSDEKLLLNDWESTFVQIPNAGEKKKKT